MNKSEILFNKALHLFNTTKPFLIIGLGNPGYPSGEISVSRHNVGFSFVNFLHKKFDFPSFKYNSTLLADITESPNTILAKPQTYMNLSGNSIKLLLKHYSKHYVLIAHDELQKPIGSFEFRFKGSARGHRGVKSIIEVLKTDQFPRICIGIDRPQDKLHVPEYVMNVMSIADATTLHNNTFEEIVKLMWNISESNFLNQNLATDIELCKIPKPTQPKTKRLRSNSYYNYIGKIIKNR